MVTGFADKGLMVRNISRNENITDVIPFDEAFFTGQDQSKILQRIEKQYSAETETNQLFSVLDSVVFDGVNAWYIILKLEEKDALVMPILNKGTAVGDTFNIKKVAIYELFIKKPNYKGLTLGNTFNLYGLRYTILFFGTEKVLVKPSSGFYERIKYEKILQEE